MGLQVYCEICGKNMTEAEESESVCDECGRIICDDCCADDGFNTVCVECE